MKSRPLPVKDQILYDVNVGNAARFSPPQPKKVIVRKVGRKYFECSPETAPHNTTKYHLEDWREVTEYSETHALYLTIEEWQEENSQRELYLELSRTINCAYLSRLTLDQLTEIKKLLQSF